MIDIGIYMLVAMGLPPIVILIQMKFAARRMMHVLRFAGLVAGILEIVLLIHKGLAGIVSIESQIGVVVLVAVATINYAILRLK